MRLLSLACTALCLSATAAPVDLPSLFDKRALVKPITEIEGILSDGSKATVYKIVVRSLPYDHAMGPGPRPRSRTKAATGKTPSIRKCTASTPTISRS